MRPFVCTLSFANTLVTLPESNYLMIKHPNPNQPYRHSLLNNIHLLKALDFTPIAAILTIIK